ncbi:hypothetical protein D7X33_10295 [Butyricicoccus sp. 1XD8-22]|nr:hypothetical protein D7X33_10295 [Butyricicoccus sp. 1XD8-22]
MPLRPAALLAGRSSTHQRRLTYPFPAAADNGSPEGRVPLAPAAQARVQGRALPLSAQDTQT